MRKFLSKLFNWFSGTWLGGLYFEFLLWLDSIQGTDVDAGPLFGNRSFSANREVARAVLELRQIAYREGVGNIKHKVNGLVSARTKEEYHKVLGEIEDLMEFAKETDPKKIEMIRILRQAVIFTGGKDIITHTDRAKMVDKRIGHFKELHSHMESRTLLRAIRKAESERNSELAAKLKKEWEEKYAKSTK